MKTHFLTNWVRVTGEFPGSRLNFASSSKTRYRVNIYTAVKPTIILRSPRNFTVLMSYINVSWSVILNSKLSGFGCTHTPLITVGRFFGIWSRSVCTSDQPTMKSCIDHNDAIWNIIRVELVVNPVLPKIFWITSENYFKRWCFSSQPLFSIVTQRVWEGICVTRPNNNGCDHPRQLNLTACQVYKTLKL